jgi:hypothetical protein
MKAESKIGESLSGLSNTLNTREMNSNLIFHRNYCTLFYKDISLCEKLSLKINYK